MVHFIKYNNIGDGVISIRINDEYDRKALKSVLDKTKCTYAILNDEDTIASTFIMHLNDVSIVNDDLFKEWLLELHDIEE